MILSDLFSCMNFIHVLKHEIFRRLALPVGSEMLPDVPRVTRGVWHYSRDGILENLSGDLRQRVS